MPRRTRQRAENGAPAPVRTPSGSFRLWIDLGKDPVTGKRVRRTVTAATVEECYAQAAKVRDSEAPLDTAQAQRQTVADYLRSWMEGRKRHHEVTTNSYYDQIIRTQIVPNIGSVRLRDLTVDHIERMLAKVAERGVKPSTANRSRRVMVTALKDAERRDLVARNVASLSKPLPERKSRRQLIPPEEVRRLLEATAGTRRYALYVIAATLGMRMGEILGLRWSDVDRTDRTLHIRGALKAGEDGSLVLGRTKNESSERTLPLIGMLVDVFTRREEEQNADRILAGDAWAYEGIGSDLVFTTRFGRPLTRNMVHKGLLTDLERTNRRGVEAAMARATGSPVRYPDVTDAWVASLTFSHPVTGEPFRSPTLDDLRSRVGIRRCSFHQLRHSAASYLAAQGVPPRTVADILGHSSTKTTLDIYTHADQGQIRAALERLGGIMPTEMSQTVVTP